MAALRKFTKDPNAVLDYTIDWSEWLPSGDIITAVTATAATGLTVVSVENTEIYTTVWLSGGTTGVSYDVVVHVTTSGGREDDRTLTIVVKDR